MTQYRSASDTVNAIQFTGGVESALAVTQWLRPYGFDSAYRPAILEGSVTEMGNPIFPTSEYLSAYLPGRGYMAIYVGTWLLRTSQGLIFSCTKEEFEAEGYKPVAEAAPEPDPLELEALIAEARNGYSGQEWVKDHHPHSAVGLAMRLADALEAAATPEPLELEALTKAIKGCSDHPKYTLIKPWVHEVIKDIAQNLISQGYRILPPAEDKL